MSERNITLSGLNVAIKRTGINDDPDKPKLTWHGLRHTCGSLLLARGASLPYVSRFLRHGDPSITARVYAHVLDEKEQDERAGAMLDEVLLGKNVESSGGERTLTQPAAEPLKVALLRD